MPDSGIVDAAVELVEALTVVGRQPLGEQAVERLEAVRSGSPGRDGEEPVAADELRVSKPWAAGLSGSSAIMRGPQTTATQQQRTSARSVRMRSPG